MKIYLYIPNAPVKLRWRTLYVEVGASVCVPKDETVESLSLTLKAEEREKPYAPRSIIRVIYDDGTISHFSLINDTVSVFSTKPLLYKHTFALQQNIKDLDNYLVRNNVFTQARATQKAFYSVFLQGNIVETLYDDYRIKELEFKGYSFPEKVYSVEEPDDFAGGKSEPIIITSHYPCQSAYIKFNFYGLYATNDQTTLTSDNNSLKLIQKQKFSDYDPKQAVVYTTIHHVASDGTETTFPVVSTDPYMNKEYELTGEILNWIKSKRDGYFYITFTSGHVNFMGGEYDKTTTSIDTYPVNIIGQIEFSIRQRKYTMYDVVQDLLNQQMKESARYNQNNDTTIKPLFLMPLEGSECYNALQAAMPDNFTFTQCTLYEALLEVFKLFDATFTIDVDGYLGIEYYNEKGDKIDNPEFSGESITHSQEYYENGYISYYQNAILETDYPQNSYVPVQSKTLGVPEIGDYVLSLPKPINFIEHLYLNASLSRIIFSQVYLEEVKFVSGGGQSAQRVFVQVLCDLDLARYLVSQEVWASLDVNLSSATTTSGLTQMNTIAFSKGASSIELAGYYNNEWNKRVQVLENAISYATRRFGGFSNTDIDKCYFAYLDSASIFSSGIDWSKLFFKIDYLCELDGRLKIESITNKDDGEILVNQGNGMVDLNKLGLNILGTAVKHGEPKLSCNYKITTWNNRIKVGQYFVKDNNIWVCNVANYTFINNDLIQGTLEFTQNYNEVASRITLNRQKRMTNISNSLTMKCEDNYDEYIYFGEDTLTPEEIVIHSQSLQELLKASLFDFEPERKIDMALCSTYYLVDEEQTTTGKNNIYVPMVKYGSGNMVCFEMSYNDPISAGNQLSVKTGWFGTNKYFSTAVLYTDNEGYADIFRIDFYSSKEDAFTNSFPVVMSNLKYGVGSDAFYYYKKPNEIFALNYELGFLPINQYTDFLGSEFINNNAFISGKGRIGTKLYVSNDTEYSIFDKKGVGSVKTIDDVAYATTTDNVLKVRITTSENIGICKSWALCDENDNILFAHNNQSGKDYEQSIEYCFTARHHRI